MKSCVGLITAEHQVLIYVKSTRKFCNTGIQAKRVKSIFDWNGIVLITTEEGYYSVEIENEE